MDTGFKDQLEVLSQFFEFDRPPDIIPFGGGHINQTFQVNLPTAQGTKHYLLQQINHHVFKQPEMVMSNMDKVARHLSNTTQLPHLLLPVPTLNRTLLATDNKGGYWRILPFITHTKTFSKVATVKHSFQGAKAFGCFLRGLLTIPSNTIFEIIPNFHNGKKRLDHFIQLVNKNRVGRLNQVYTEVKYIQQEGVLFDQIANWPLPQRVVHNDPKISNILFDASTEEAVCVVDWDTIMPGSILTDFGDMVRAFTSTTDEDDVNAMGTVIQLSLFEALCQGFLPEIRDILTPIEKEKMIWGARWIILEQAIRFLGDYLDGDLYYKTAYPDHNLVRARNQIALYRSVVEQQAKMQNIIQEIIHTEATQ